MWVEKLFENSEKPSPFCPSPPEDRIFDPPVADAQKPQWRRCGEGIGVVEQPLDGCLGYIVIDWE
jgi:hypothetical protein